MRYFIKSKGTSHEVLIDDDVPLAWTRSSMIVWGGGKIMTSKWPYVICSDEKLLHRKILNAADHEICDHINGNTLDNRRENLRIVTAEQNTWNRKENRTNTTGFRGVTWDKRRSKYVAGISSKNKRINIGVFDDPVLAAKAYDSEALRLRGSWAKLNFPGDVPTQPSP